MSSAALVVDASVALKWLGSEEGSDAALHLLDRQQLGRLVLIAPRQAAAEVASALVRRHRRDRLTPAEVMDQFAIFLSRIDQFEGSDAIDELALRLALSSGQSLYDCLYLAVALQFGCDLITADERFYNAMRARFGCLKLLGC